MQRSFEFCKFAVDKAPSRTIQSKDCLQQCSFGENEYYAEHNEIFSYNTKFIKNVEIKGILLASMGDNIC